jgi:hypothetical protein
MLIDSTICPAPWYSWAARAHVAHELASESPRQPPSRSPRKDFFDSHYVENLPAALKILAAIQTILGAILLFLFGLGIRNKCRMKADRSPSWAKARATVTRIEPSDHKPGAFFASHSWSARPPTRLASHGRYPISAVAVLAL